MLKKEPGNLFTEMVRMLVSVIEEKDVLLGIDSNTLDAVAEEVKKLMRESANIY